MQRWFRYATYTHFLRALKQTKLFCVKFGVDFMRNKISKVSNSCVHMCDRDL